jgi:hypothetical protein
VRDGLAVPPQIPALATLACPSRTYAGCLFDLRRRGYDDLSLTGGGSQILTPTLQRLATEGIVMSNYYVNPICTPTRTRCALCRVVVCCQLARVVSQSVSAYMQCVYMSAVYVRGNAVHHHHRSFMSGRYPIRKLATPSRACRRATH